MVTVNHGDEMNLVLNSIGWYAVEHKLTPEQVRDLFHAGIAAAATAPAQEQPL